MNNPLNINLDYSNKILAVVIPCYKVKSHILGLISNIGSEVTQIYIIDDCCPEATGDFIEASCKDNRVRIIRHKENQGVGGAVMSGYNAALRNNADIIVKIDGDGQMDPTLIPSFVFPILNGQADYTKGNRFINIEDIKSMPKIRLFGNAILSFFTKFSSGYWDLFDPTNGYTAIHAGTASALPLSKISKRYFFESDMLFRLNIIRAVVIDIPMKAKYGNEVSGLNISKILFEFLFKNFRNLLKRIFYNYYLRDISLASIELPLGIVLICFGIIFGGYHWSHARDGVLTSAGTVMLSALPLLMGLQLVLAFLSFDISSVPRTPRQLLIGNYLNKISRPKINHHIE